MTFVDFSHWAVITILAGSAVKYLFSDVTAALERRFERSMAGENGYSLACRIHPLIARLVPLEKYELSEKYAETNYRFGMFSGYFERAVSLAIIVLCAYPSAIDIFMKWRFFAEYPVTALIMASAAVDIAITAVNVPFSLYDTFVIEKKFGFNTQTLSCWFADLVKDFVIGQAYSAAVISAAYCGMLAFATWTGYGLLSFQFVAAVTCIQVAFGLFWESLYIRIIAPMFNRFIPLDDKDLGDRIMKLISDAGYSVSGIYVMDAGRRSRHSNAYFTGWGRNKRIVLYDTLLNAHTKDEILAILGHEVGHLVHGDITRGRIVDAVWSALRTVAIACMVSNVGFYRAFGFDFVDSSNIAHWYVAGWWFAETVLTSVEWLSAPVWNFLSRKQEYAADRWSCDHVGKKPMAAALVRLYAENLSGIHDYPFCEFWYYSHPGLKNRIAAMQ